MFVLGPHGDRALLEEAVLAGSARLAAVLADAATDASVGLDDGDTNAAHGVQFDLGEHAFRWRRDELDTDLLHLDRIIPSLLAFDVTQIAVLAESVLAQRQARASESILASPMWVRRFTRQFQGLNGPGRTDLRAEVAVLMAAGVLRMRHRCP